MNGQIAGTGWLGYARVDYRNGDRVEGWGGTGGIRYQLTPLGKQGINASIPADDEATELVFTGRDEAVLN